MTDIPSAEIKKWIEDCRKSAHDKGWTDIDFMIALTDVAREVAVDMAIRKANTVVEKIIKGKG